MSTASNIRGLAMASIISVAGSAAGARGAEPPIAGRKFTGVASLAPSPARLVRITNLSSGQVVDFGADRPSGATMGGHHPLSPRGGTVVFDTMTNEASSPHLNVALLSAGSYTGADPSTLAPFIGLAERDSLRAPTDFSQGLPFPTDMVWDDYTSDHTAWPGNGLQAVTRFAFVPYIRNVDPPPNGTRPVTRIDTARIRFYSADGRTGYGGFTAAFQSGPGFTGYFGSSVELDALDPPVMAPRDGIVLLDWIEPNNAGVGTMFIGGDLGNPAFPRPETLWTAGSCDLLTWYFSDGITGLDGWPSVIDPGIDGEPASVSDLDALNGGRLANWQYTLGNPPILTLSHDFPFRITVGATPVCPCDINLSGSVNSQDFFDFLGGFFQGNQDFNQSGDTNSQDLFDFLICFFSAC